MLFKIGDMLIIADSTECARAIFQRESKSHLALPVQILIDEKETFTYINTDLTKIADIHSLVKGCIENIKNRYKDSLISVKSIFKHLDVLNAEQIDMIFQALINNGFNESKSLIYIYSNMVFGETIPNNFKQRWNSDMTSYICKHWLMFDREQNQWTIGPKCKILFETCEQIGILQYDETEERISNLHNTRSRLDRIKLLNSVNFSYETLESYTDEHPDKNWVLDHYDFKQKVVREGNVECINENRNGDRAIL